MEKTQGWRWNLGEGGPGGAATLNSVPRSPLPRPTPSYHHREPLHRLVPSIGNGPNKPGWYGGLGVLRGWG